LGWVFPDSRRGNVFSEYGDTLLTHNTETVKLFPKYKDNNFSEVEEFDLPGYSTLVEFINENTILGVYFDTSELYFMDRTGKVTKDNITVCEVDDECPTATLSTDRTLLALGQLNSNHLLT